MEHVDSSKRDCFKMSYETSIVPKELLEEVTGCNVLSYTVGGGSKPGDGNMSDLYSISAQVIPQGGSADSEKEERHYLIKCYPKEAARQVYLNKTNMFYNELSFYKTWTREMHDFQVNTLGLQKDQVITPACPPCAGGTGVNFLTAGSSDAQAKVYEPLDNFVMLIDLRKTWDYRMADRRQGLDLDHLRLAFTELANIHALSWAYKTKGGNNPSSDRFPCLNVPFDQNEFTVWLEIMDVTTATACVTFDTALGVDNPLSSSTQVVRKNARKIIEYFINQDVGAERDFWSLHRDPPTDLVEASANEEPWRVICHGDSYCNNYLFRYDDAGKPERIMLVDFQMTREGCPTVDLVNAIYTSTTAEFRKAHLDQVLSIYCDRFVEVCRMLKVEPLPGFSLESLKRRFHRSKLHGYMIAVICLTVMFVMHDKEASSSSSVYPKRILDIAQEMYDDGVI